MYWDVYLGDRDRERTRCEEWIVFVSYLRGDLKICVDDTPSLDSCRGSRIIVSHGEYGYGFMASPGNGHS